eukprot:INCI5139.52.p1 GENE.INCI5139.52~~INCI5139.52.p1  ORF type:complete len:225 (-),score=34.83 INCI5139.52:191-865(-)
MSFLTEIRAPSIAHKGRRLSQQGEHSGRYRPASAPVRRASGAARERSKALMLLRKRPGKWKDSRPIQSLAELPEAIKSRTKRVEEERTSAFLAAQRKAQHHHVPRPVFSAPSSRSSNKSRRSALRQAVKAVKEDSLVPFSSSPAAGVLAEFELSQRSVYSQKVTSPKQVGFMRALHRIEKKHNISSFTQKIAKFQPRSASSQRKLTRKPSSSNKLEWRSIKLGP